jgi:hypothetical protein
VVLFDTFQTSENRQLDLLFVIDDPPAMASYAEQLSSGIASMASVLDDLARDTSLHIGVVPASPCSAPPISFIRSTSREHLRRAHHLHRRAGTTPTDAPPAGRARVGSRAQ